MISCESRVGELIRVIEGVACPERFDPAKENTEDIFDLIEFLKVFSVEIERKRGFKVGLKGRR